MKRARYYLNKNLNRIFALRPSFYKNTIEDPVFKDKWEKEKNNRLEKQKDCFYCEMPFDNNRIPILHHRNMPLKEEEVFAKRTEISIKVINGEMNVADASAIYLKLMAELTEYYKSLADTDLICTLCHQLQHKFYNRYKNGQRKLH